MEGHLPCLKFIVSVNRDIASLLGARNDQGDTPKSLAEQFYKEHCCQYLDALEWEHDHPEQAESNYKSMIQRITSTLFFFFQLRSRFSGTYCSIQWQFRASKIVS